MAAILSRGRWVNTLALGHDCPSTSEATLKNMANKSHKAITNSLYIHDKIIDNQQIAYFMECTVNIQLVSYACIKYNNIKSLVH